jgi:hypothetical protein
MMRPHGGGNRCLYVDLVLTWERDLIERNGANSGAKRAARKRVLSKQ